MVVRKEALISQPRVNLKDGEGAFSSTPLLSPEQFYSRGRSFSRVAMPPGTSIGYHRHEGDFEAYYILSGTAEFTDNGTVTTVSAGDLCYTPEGSCHGIKNSGQSLLEFIALVIFTR